jgi:hypothetical protein
MAETKIIAPLAEVRRNVQEDKQAALRVIEVASHARKNNPHFVFSSDITGRPDINRRYQQAKREEFRGLETISRAPFYRRLNVMMDVDGTVEELKILITEAPYTGGNVTGDGWQVVSAYSTLGTKLEGGRLGGEVVVQMPKRAPVRYQVRESTSYVQILPTFTNGEFLLDSGKAAFANEADLNASEIPSASLAELPPKLFEAKATFGLSDILVLRDDPQIAAMGLPFDKSVVIDGPPGSGKTTIGIMRIKGLYVRQWDELGLNREKDVPFHDYSTMRVLVYSPEMEEYLKGLLQSIDLSNVRVQTTYDYFRQICRRTKLLTGTKREDKSSLALMKGRREALQAFFAGMRLHAVRYWDQRGDTLRRALNAIGSDFELLASTMESWIGRLASAEVVGDNIYGTIGIVDPLSDAASDILNGKSRTRNRKQLDTTFPDEVRVGLNQEALKRGLSSARELIEEFLAGACSRVGAVHTMFTLAEFVELKRSMEAEGIHPRVVAAGERLWRKQYEGSQPAFSELDLAASAWVGGKLLLSSRATGAKPWIGGRLDPLTHVVVDEVQDLSPIHVAVLSSQLSLTGTMTLVGDLHQNLNPHGGLRGWRDIATSTFVHASFGINHRQTQQLGNFVRELHSRMFVEECKWRSSNKLAGSKPRAGACRTWSDLARAVAIEARHWRDTITGDYGATVAVLYDGRIKPKRLKWLREQVAEALQNDLVEVEVAKSANGGDVLRRTDRVIIASVRQAKGLEFDAVVLIESKARWSKPVDEIDLRTRNAFYVAASRARAGLSLCMSNLPACIQPMIDAGFCDRVSWESNASDASGTNP